MIDLSSKQIFINYFNEIMFDTCNQYIINTVSNMLAINYAIDEGLRNKFPNLDTYANICIRRVQTHYGEIVILEENFDKALEVFAIAIADPAIKEVGSEEQMIANTISNFLGDDLDEDQKLELKNIIKKNVKIDNPHKISDLIKSVQKSKSLMSSNALNLQLSVINNVKEVSGALEYVKNFAIISAIFSSMNLLLTQGFGNIAYALAIPVTNAVSVAMYKVLGTRYISKNIVFDSISMKDTQNTTLGKIENLDLNQITKDLSIHISNDIVYNKSLPNNKAQQIEGAREI
jgi:hypothetical protein